MEGVIVYCAKSSNCKLQYQRNYTPVLYAVTPANVARDDWMQFHINVFSAHQTTGTPADQWPFREMRLGETLMDWEFSIE